MNAGAQRGSSLVMMAANDNDVTATSDDKSTSLIDKVET